MTVLRGVRVFQASAWLMCEPVFSPGSTFLRRGRSPLSSWLVETRQQRAVLIYETRPLSWAATYLGCPA